MMKTVYIAGIGSSIGQALATQFIANGQRVISSGRAPSVAVDGISSHLQVDSSQTESVALIKDWLEQSPSPDCVICCNGTLHHEDHMPEKNLKAMSAAWLHHSVDANVISHMHVAQAVSHLIKRSKPITWVSLSAMVGSIEDNHLGGWYSYRMTKAALNMLIKNLAIEWGRKAPESKVIALHPGTTVSPLSKPFQATVKPEKLYTTETTATRLHQVITHLDETQHGKLLHWDGSVIPF